MKDLGGLVDGLIVAVGTGVFLWVFLMAPTASDTTLTVADRLIGCAYPAGDLLLITIGAQVAVRQLRRGIPFWTLTASLLFMLIADVGYVPIAPQHVLRRRAARRRVVDQLRADRRRRGAPRRVRVAEPLRRWAIAPDRAATGRPRRDARPRCSSRCAPDPVSRWTCRRCSAARW